ncbi:LURP-one-related/scramblase family protein [Marinactinospora rubrisoli]|uniref:LURP-one-related/scramblase family protein n=1 Tax=Marinactinospora rubrisoli TaxID=2715399 RepID=A0ABW2KAS7_9ACTN
MTDLFTSPVLLVEQPRRYFIDESEYHVHDPQGRPLAHVGELNLNAGRRVLRFVAKDTSNFRRTLQVRAPDGRPLLIIDKQFGFVTPRTLINLPDGRPIGRIDQEFTLLKPKFRLLDAHERPIGEITGDFTGWDFVINDGHGTEVGRVTKRFAGLASELLTEADRYAVEFRFQLPDPLRTLVVASGIALDAVLREGK